MLQANKAEISAIKKAVPGAYVKATVHKNYVEETAAVVRALQEYRKDLESKRGGAE